MPRTVTACFTAGALCTMVLAHPADALALFRTYHAVECVVDNASPQGSPWIDSTNGQVVNVSSNTLDLLCPVQNDSWLPLNDGLVTSIDVSGWTQGGSTVFAYACRTYYGGNGGACSASPGQSPPLGTVYHINPSFEQWTAGANNDSYYIRVQLPPGSFNNGYVVWEYNVQHS
jgi:hypothetical protein